jgi:hypothetical protein
MALRRLQLHELLVEILGTNYVYFHPPPTVSMVYPCLVYKRDFADTKFADNQPYNSSKRYQVTVIDRDPDSEIPERIAALPKCVFDRFFTADDLNHDVYKLFF